MHSHFIIQICFKKKVCVKFVSNLCQFFSQMPHSPDNDHRLWQQLDQIYMAHFGAEMWRGKWYQLQSVSTKCGVFTAIKFQWHFTPCIWFSLSKPILPTKIGKYCELQKISRQIHPDIFRSDQREIFLKRFHLWRRLQQQASPAKVFWARNNGNHSEFSSNLLPRRK